ncbi:EamA family transporter [Streptomyces sp. NPDC032472]|uniref:EamA family transporter n=1 Tax=Streptomyces sp. NPDC032472 TaxID=3155018 RepID=UPI0033D87ACB
MVALVSTTLLGHALAAGQALGIAVVACGLAGLALALGIPGRTQLPAPAAALGTGVMTASYTLVEGTGVRVSGSVFGCIAWLFLCEGLVLPIVARARRGPALLTVLRPLWGRGLAGGLLSLLAYGLVVWAQSRGDLSTIAALRETSIVFGALIGAVVFRERLGHRRITASITVLRASRCSGSRAAPEDGAGAGAGGQCRPACRTARETRSRRRGRACLSHRRVKQRSGVRNR